MPAVNRVRGGESFRGPRAESARQARVPIAGAAGPVLALLIAAVLVAGCGGGPERPQVVAASSPPVAALTEMVVGHRMPVVSLLPNGRSPHDFEPTPSQVDRVRRALLFVYVGEDPDGWLKRAAIAVAGEHAPLVSMRSVAPEADRDPHLWLDLDAVRAFLPVLAESLAAHDPADEVGYRARAKAALDSLDAFDAWAGEKLAPVRTVPFAILHPAFEDFVRHYGLNLVAVLQYQAEGEALPRTLGEITGAMRAAHAKIVFAESHLSPKVAETMAHEIGGRVGILDPLGLWNDRREGDYLDLLRRNVSSLVENLSEPVE